MPNDANMNNLTSEDSPSWQKLLEMVFRVYGPTMIMLIVIIYGAYNFALWTESTIITPFWKAHIQQMEIYGTSTKQQTEVLQTQTQILQNIDKTTKDNGLILNQHNEYLRELARESPVRFKDGTDN